MYTEWIWNHILTKNRIFIRLSDEIIDYMLYEFNYQNILSAVLLLIKNSFQLHITHSEKKAPSPKGVT